MRSRQQMMTFRACHYHCSRRCCYCHCVIIATLKFMAVAYVAVTTTIRLRFVRTLPDSHSTTIRPLSDHSTTLQPYGVVVVIIRLMPRSHSGALSDDAPDVCLSVAYIAPNSRTESPRKTKIGPEVAHVTRDSDTTFKVKWLKVNLQGAGHIVAASRAACYCYYYYYC